MISREEYAVYLVTDDPSRYSGDFVEAVEQAISGGVTVVQYRDTESTGRVMYERVCRLQSMLKVRNIPLIINNNADLAVAIQADGIHVGQSDLPPEAVRRVIGSKMTLGLSVTCPDEIKTVSELVDYVGVGPVYDATKTKRDAAPEMGLSGLNSICQQLADYPIIAIGGITLERAEGIYTAGADGLAIVSAFSRVANPTAAAHGFLDIYRKCR